MPPETIYLTTRQVADILQCRSTEAVVRLIRQGALPCARVRVGHAGRPSYRPTVGELLAYLEVYDPALVPKVTAKWPGVAA